jgi:3-dehydroquinate synthetase
MGRQTEMIAAGTGLGSWTLKTHLPVTFSIKNSPGLFSVGNRDLLQHGSQGASARRMVVIDRNICQYYLEGVIEYFEAHDVICHVVVIDATEDRKDLETLLSILREMEQFGVLRRDEPLIAVGGGVLLDLVGMAAGLYRRGVPYIRVPTTLVGLIDASVGAKTGINFENRRNRLGSYYPPIAAYLDRSFLKTLPEIEISSGLGEILKMAVIKDRLLFQMLERNGQDLLGSKFMDSSVADDVINRSVQGMLDELEPNLWETDLKRIVDFGHSFSPIIEMRSISDPDVASLTHGQAVALDVIFSSIISSRRGLLSHEDLLRIVRTARETLLPTGHELFYSPLIVLEALKDTMKHRNGDQNLPVPKALGDAIFINDLSFEEIKAASEDMRKINYDLFGLGEKK